MLLSFECGLALRTLCILGPAIIFIKLHARLKTLREGDLHRPCSQGADLRKAVLTSVDFRCLLGLVEK